ncbi:MAG: transglutaminase domain-containing protein, partial [Thermoplasmata archaeon]|nr:transglutaminase domain-containing protein [Thermoplasmata archaeon]
MNDLSFLSVPLPYGIKEEIDRGNFKIARNIIKRYISRDIPEPLKHRLEYELERMRRLRMDFPYSREKALQILHKELKNFREEELDKWIDLGIVDRMLIDGKERFFVQFLANIIFLEPKLKKRRTRKDRLGEYLKNLIEESIKRINEGETKKYRVQAGIKLHIKKKIPEGEKYRVWLPLPRESFQSSNVKILAAEPANYYVSDEDLGQRTVYFESSRRDYHLEFVYEIEEVRGGVEGSRDEKYLHEKPPHIIFTPYLKTLAAQIAGDADNDYEKAYRIYKWITTHVNYTFVRAYSTYHNISEFVASSLRGDCGFMALLFITLCRILGIPAKWQSGWFITPKHASPHDWAQVYIDGKWLPVDASFGNAIRHGSMRNQFYFGNLDAFRMIANDEFMADFVPEKRFVRTDPTDNQ